MILLEFILTFDCEETRNEKNRKHEESIQIRNSRRR